MPITSTKSRTITRSAAYAAQWKSRAGEFHPADDFNQEIRELARPATRPQTTWHFNKRSEIFGQLARQSSYLVHQVKDSEVASLQKQVAELKLQIQAILEHIDRGQGYEDIEVPDDELEAFLCNGKTYRDEYPNSFLAIDVTGKKILFTSTSEDDFINKLGKYSEVKNLRVIDTFEEMFR